MRSAAGDWQISADELNAGLEGFDQDQLVIRWATQPQYAVRVDIKQLQPQDLKGAPEAFARTLRNIRTRSGHFQRRFRRIAWITAAIVLIPTLLIVLFLGGSQRVSDIVLSQIPHSIDEQMGALGMEAVKAEYELRQSGADYAAVQSIYNRLQTDGAFEIRLHIADINEVNAFALPGGDIVIQTGLINASNSPEELAAVLAHEIQHVEQRHGTELMLKRLGIGVVWVLLTGDLVSLSAAAATELLGLNFTRSAEEEADELGLQQLLKQGVAPEGMVSFFERLAEQDTALVPGFLRTHPHSDDRAQRIQAMIEHHRTDSTSSFATTRPLLPGQPWPPQAAAALSPEPKPEAARSDPRR